MSRNLQAALGAAGLALAFSANALVIDDFTFAPAGQDMVERKVNQGVGTVDTTQACGGGASIIGGCRDMFIIIRDATNGGTATASPNANALAEVDTAAGALSFSTAANVTGTAIIRWDGTNSGFGSVVAGNPIQTIENAIASIDASGLNGFAATNLLAAGNAFNFGVSTSDLSGWSFQIWAYSTTGASLFQAPINAALIGQPIPFAALVPVIGGGADFTQITALQAVINYASGMSATGPLASLDLSIGSVSVVPTPATLALVGLGLFAAGVASRRRVR